MPFVLTLNVSVYYITLLVLSFIDMIYMQVYVFSNIFAQAAVSPGFESGFSHIEWPFGLAGSLYILILLKNLGVKTGTK